MIKASDVSVQRHLQDLQTKIKKNRNTEALISTLSPIIRGWCNYYRFVVSTAIFARCEKILIRYLFSWAKRKHSRRPRKWVLENYFKKIVLDARTGTNSRHLFGFKKGETFIYLKYHTTVKIKRHVKVVGEKSPYDGDFIYWTLRNTLKTSLSPSFIKLLKKQKGRCTRCFLYFAPTDIIEIDHIIPKIKGGKNTWDNLQLLHGHCHDAKSAEDRV